MTIEEMYTRYGNIQRAKAYRVLGSWDAAEDAVHDAFAKLIRIQQMSGKELNSGYLDRTVRCVCLDTVAKQKRRPEVVRIEPADDVVIAWEESGYEDFNKQQLAEQALRSLTSRQADVLRLRGRGYTHLETAAALGLTEDAVKHLQARGQRQARRMAS